ncbi:MAG TPA: substrate-binding domain-containing protein [Bdellovibrionota bacterium]|nr:substrate-binding domain-containing protein [Bdellovibrionota bacterium]
MNRAVVVLVFLVLFSLNAFAVNQKVKIGFILSTMQEERYQKDKAIFEKEVTKLGAEVLFESCNNNEQTQAAKVENLLAKGVQVLVIQPVNGDAAGTFVREAHEDKVKVIAYDRLIKNADLDFYVTQDSFKVGVLQAEAAVKATQGKGNYAVLMGQSGHSVAQEITRGNLSVLKKYPDIKIVVQQSHDNWSSQEAMATVENALTKHKNKIDAILANNSGMAHGAVQALKEQNLLGKVFVAGADADLSAVKNIVLGHQQFEVLKAIQPLAQSAAEVAVKLAKNENPKNDGVVFNGKINVKTLNTPVYPVTKDNLKAQIIDTGFHSAKDVYGKE